MTTSRSVEKLIRALQCDHQDCECHKNKPGKYMLHCPAHDDQHPSLSLTLRNNLMPLVYCHAGCPQEVLLAALRTWGRWSNGGGEVYASVKADTPLHAPRLTLATLADAKKLPVDFLRQLGITDSQFQGVSAVRIPYANENGDIVAIRYRVGLASQGPRFKWRKGDHAILYGLERLEEIQRAGWVLLVEGESDCWSAWFHNLPTLGIPGKSIWHAEWVEKYLAGLDVFVWQEPNAEDLILRIAKTLPQFRVIRAPAGIKDLSEAHILGYPIATVMTELREQAVAIELIRDELARQHMADQARQAAPVLDAPDPLPLIEHALRRLGYGGDIRPALIAYLATTSRLLKMRDGSMLAHLLLSGTPSAGKSWTVKCVLRLLPEGAYVVIDAGSPRALIYTDADLCHRVVVFGEADSLPAGEDDSAASAIRNLLQDGYLRYTTTVRDSVTGKFTTHQVEKPGPTVVITTAVRKPGGQLITRFFAVEMADTHEQLRAALETQAQREVSTPADPDPALIAFQSYLQARVPWDVQVPFAPLLATEITQSPAAPRILRDFERLLSLIKVVTVLRHRQRKTSFEGRLIAQIEDYATVWKLTNDIYADSVSDINEKTCQTVARVAELRGRGVRPISVTRLADELKISKMAASRRVQVALKGGWLINRESRDGQPYDLDLGEPLPTREGLPEPNALLKACNAVTPLTEGNPSPLSIARHSDLAATGDAQE